jgi:hypothetical protein
LSGFSRLYPRPGPQRDFAADNRETAILRHFSVMQAGIQPYWRTPIKTLSANPRIAQYSRAFRGKLSPQFTVRTQDLVFDSDLTSIYC